MKRNSHKQAEMGKQILKGTKRDFSANELYQMYDIFKRDPLGDGLFNLVVEALYFGAAVGYAQAKADEKKGI